jgi:hypothetical protein
VSGMVMGMARASCLPDAGGWSCLRGKHGPIATGEPWGLSRTPAGPFGATAQVKEGAAVPARWGNGGWHALSPMRWLARRARPARRSGLGTTRSTMRSTETRSCPARLRPLPDAAAPDRPSTDCSRPRAPASDALTPRNRRSQRRWVGNVRATVGSAGQQSARAPA